MLSHVNMRDEHLPNIRFYCMVCVHTHHEYYVCLRHTHQIAVIHPYFLNNYNAG